MFSVDAILLDLLNYTLLLLHKKTLGLMCHDVHRFPELPINFKSTEFHVSMIILQLETTENIFLPALVMSNDMHNYTDV